VPDELARIAELRKTNFGIGPEPARYKGTMDPPTGAAIPMPAHR
jgi:hypothetical protein